MRGATQIIKVIATEDGGRGRDGRGRNQPALIVAALAAAGKHDGGNGANRRNKNQIVFLGSLRPGSSLIL